MSAGALARSLEPFVGRERERERESAGIQSASGTRSSASWQFALANGRISLAGYVGGIASSGAQCRSKRRPRSGMCGRAARESSWGGLKVNRRSVSWTRMDGMAGRPRGRRGRRGSIAKLPAAGSSRADVAHEESHASSIRAPPLASPRLAVSLYRKLAHSQ